MTPPQVRVLERAAALPHGGERGRCNGPDRAPRRGPGRIPGRRLAALMLTVIRREWLTALFGLFAIFAALTALITTNPPERLWGELAAVSYAVSAVIAAVARRRGATVAVLVSLAGALFAPLAWMASTGLAQPEVHVIIHSAGMLLHSGTPYASPAALAAAHTWQAYDPYLPALIAFGVPRALAGGLLTDPRVWFGVAFVITFGLALWVAGVPRPRWWTVLVVASPVVALPVAVGGDDLPVLGLVCLGLALAGRTGAGHTGAGHTGAGRTGAGRTEAGRWRWPVAAGLALGLAVAMKATAWPALAVVFILVASRGGWRAAGRFLLSAVGLAVLIDGPVVVANPAATVANTVTFPLGLANVASPAASQLPGHMLASAGTWGHWTAIVLMAAAGVGVVAWLLIRPPVDAQSAGWRLVIGLTLLFGLAPASRVGYFMYPAGLAAWLLLSRWAGAGRTVDRAGRPEELSVDPVPALGRQAVTGLHD